MNSKQQADSFRQRRLTISEGENKYYCYPSPKYSALIKAYAVVNEISESKAGAKAVKEFIDNLPPDIKERVIQVARGCTPNGNAPSKNNY